ncbi:hypothetical protein [Flavobacterium terrisoli]|uniref:hypothetical protein n=1 Tax=Flavobacterium terrisoli TaxID=3242195 RepID=UPI002543550D|nr:hypothetical protein [Flavobacterium buctense]
MITEQDLLDLGYSKIEDSTRKYGKNFLTRYRHDDENRNYSISLTDDGILTSHFPINLLKEPKGMVNVTDLEIFTNWHNNQ